MASMRTWLGSSALLAGMGTAMLCGAGLAAVLVALPPAEAGDFVSPAFPLRVFLIEFCQHLLGRVKTLVVLFSGIPIHRLRLGAFLPAIGRLLVSGMDPGDALLVGLLEALPTAPESGGGEIMGMKALKDYVEFKSGGELEIRLFFNTFGGSLQVTEQVKNGTLEMALTDDSVLGSFHKPMQVFQIPYLFPS